MYVSVLSQCKNCQFARLIARHKSIGSPAGGADLLQLQPARFTLPSEADLSPVLSWCSFFALHFDLLPFIHPIGNMAQILNVDGDVLRASYCIFASDETGYSTTHGNAAVVLDRDFLAHV